MFLYKHVVSFVQDDVLIDPKPSESKLCGNSADENDGLQVHTLKEAKTNNFQQNDVV